MIEMNAAEMRKKSKSNGYKLAISMQDKFISQANTLIEGRASQGYFNALVPVVKSSVWENYNLTKTVCNHYKDLGFKVEVTNFMISIKFIISWGEGDESYVD
jgi:hypothetical protein